jgi:hypothetical protein
LLPASGTKQEFLERRLWRNLQEPSRLNGGLKICRMQKFLGPRKKLACANSARKTDWMVWYRKIGLLLNALLNVSMVLH